MSPLPSNIVTDGLTLPLGAPVNTGSLESASSDWPHFMTGQADQPVRVILVDDDPHMRRVISNELLSDLRINLVGQAASVREGKRLISSHELDVMLVDINLETAQAFSSLNI